MSSEQILQHLLALEMCLMLWAQYGPNQLELALDKACHRYQADKGIIRDHIDTLNNI